MSIKPVTYQGVTNFKANLYALEVKSRFIDQSAADGYYKGYGDELSAIVSSNVITVGSGALLVQGRLNEIEPGGEPVTVPIQNGYYGYIVARIETYHPNDYNNCTLLAKTAADLKTLTNSLSKDDTYQRAAESQNKAYEVPLYSFYMTGGAITNLTKVIQPVEENTHTREIANAALAKINEAYAAIEEMLAQSYVESAGKANSAGNAESADEATALTAGFKKVFIPSGETVASVELTKQKAYAISFTWNGSSSYKTVILFVDGVTSVCASSLSAVNNGTAYSNQLYISYDVYAKEMKLVSSVNATGFRPSDGYFYIREL